jgi:lipopolysaccharide transport system ATP-binding protein
MSNDNEILVKVDGVSKKFCRDLKKSLWYGVKDVASELLPFGKQKSGIRSQDSDENREATSSKFKIQNSKFPSPSLRDGEFWAVKDVSFELRRGECIGLIGHNGAGKTTLLKMLNGLIKPDEGTIEMRGRVGALIALGAGFNPILTGRENIYVNGSILGLTKEEIDAKINDIIDFAEIPEFIDSPVQSYSSGMQVRLGFAVATALNPDILIVDEVLAVGDFRFRWKCLQRIKNLRQNGVSIILVSHQAADLMRTCDYGVLLNRGKLEFHGPIQEALHQYEEARRDNQAGSAMEKHLGGAKIEKLTIKLENSNSPTRIVVDVTILADVPLERIRLVLGLFHSYSGALFHVSSYLDQNWLSLSKGRNQFQLELSGFSLQSGTCSLEVSLRGEGLADVYDHKQSQNQVHILDTPPNFEGFGINGVILPDRVWKRMN